MELRGRDFPFMFSVSIPAKASMRLDFSVKIIDLVKSFSPSAFHVCKMDARLSTERYDSTETRGRLVKWRKEKKYN